MKRFVFVLFVILTVIIISSCAVPEESGSPIVINTPDISAEKGELFELESETLDGQKFKCGEFFAKNKLTVINIWATWCQPCVSELPNLERINNDFKDRGVAVVGILFDSNDDGAIAEGKSILMDKAVTFTQLQNNDIIQRLIINPYSIQSLPTTLFVDSNGNVIKTEVGSNSYDGWSRVIESILK